MRPAGRSRSPVDFLDEVVLPALFERLDQAFPDFGWRRTAAGWTATNRDHTKGLPGAPRPERVVCNRPMGFLVQGHGATSWTAYVAGGAQPTGRDFVEAVRTLAGLAGVDASCLDRELTPEEAAAHAERERRQGLLEAFAARAQQALRGDAGTAARDYLTGRGFPADPDELAALGFGVFTTGRAVRDELVAAGYTPDEVDRSGLLADGRWEGRLVLPWRGRWGYVATVVARDLAGTAEEGAKYLYLKDHRKPEAFGLDVALRPDAGGRDHLVLVEGLLDVVALHHRGFRNVAALGGSGKLLDAKRWAALAGYGVRTAVLVLDNDRAGREGTLAAVDAALRSDAAPAVWVVDPAELGTCKDPDELVRRDGLDAFRALLDRRQTAAVYQLVAALGDVTPGSQNHERRAAVDRFLEVDGRLRGPAAELDREDALRLVADRTGYTVEALAERAEDHRERRARERAERDLRRQLRDAEAALVEQADVWTVAADLAAGLAEVQVAKTTPPPTFSVDRLLEEAAQLPQGLVSGWRALDALAVPFNPGELALLAARTGHGKTAFVVNLVARWLPDAGDELVVFYSAEEPEGAVFRRLVALLTAAAAERVGRRDGRWTVREVQAHLQGAPSPSPDGTWPPQDGLDQAVAQLREWEDRLLVVHRPGWTVDELVAHAVTVGRARPVRAVVVDYLQRIYPPAARYDRRDLEVSAVARRLKSLAVDLQAPVVAGAQISRQAVNEAGTVPAGDYDERAVQKAIRKRRPQLHHLREGGSEQEADLVLGLLNYRADYTQDADGERREGVGTVPAVTRLEVGALKNRYGPPGDWAALAFDGRYGFLRDPARDEEV